MKKLTVVLASLLLVLSAVSAAGSSDTESTIRSYTEDASPKYVFMFIGDGMSSPQTNSAQVYNGRNESGLVELDKLTFTQFPIVGLQYTQDSTSFCPDSASTATSLSSGYKTHSGVIGMGVDRVTPGTTIAEMLHDKGWKIGIVSTVTINHATPAAFYAHIASRNDYYDIGLQMAESGFEYFAGGSVNKADDGEKSIYEVLADNGYMVTNDKDTILSLNSNSGKVYAYSPVLQDDGAMPYAIDAPADSLRLKDFVKKGIDVLYNETGFFMMVEGGKIDWAGHANDAVANMSDTIALDEAVEVALEFAKDHPDETLILVTGDHETGGMTIGYAATGYNTAFDILRAQKCSYIQFDSYVEEAKADGSFTFDDMMAMVEEYFGLVAPGQSAENEALVMNDYEYAKLQKAYEDDQTGNTDGYEESLLYGGYSPISVTLTHIINNKAGIGWTSYAHTGLPVPVYAYGEGAELFSGAYDNTEVALRLMDLTNAR
ncbi:MAG: alkaline phosphatase [Spirochaetes bacterium]|uniref:Alkaline phosphatase n=1 Tax=Candidatus Ornithospirochaeta stercoripullorum TaxID=2840899 RepID=A0A9D9H607_9SPIO|nr:alkaline phosphatase [Candidatus Ornithospirochaeta stercoripullorum]